LVTLGRLEGRSPLFQWMNLIGAATFAVNRSLRRDSVLAAVGSE